MPLYEYECDACGHRFEVIVKFSDPPLETCPTCGGHVHKLISSPAFQFKGTGWYVTDYAKKDHVPAGKTGASGGESGGTDDKAGKSEKSDQGEKSDKSGSSEKSDKSGSADSSTSSSPATPAPSSATNASKKD